MKKSFFIPPGIAVLGSALWLGSQHWEISALEEKTSVIRERIAAYEALPVVNDGAKARKKELEEIKGPFLENGSIDLVALGTMLQSANRGGGMPSNIRLFIKVQKALMEMEPEELERSLRLLKRLQMPEANRRAVESTLTGVLIQKDPEKSLTLFQDKLNDPAMSWQLSNALQQWARENPTGALAWFDEQKAAGRLNSRSLDPNSSSGNRYEATVLSALYESDPEQLKTRLQGMDEKKRKMILSDSYLWNRAEGGAQAYYSLVREHLGKNNQLEVIANSVAAGVMQQGGLEEASKKLREVELAGDEREAAVEKVAEQYARPWMRDAEDLKEILPWAQKEDPERADELVVKTFVTFANHGNTDFEETFGELLTLADANDKPDYLDDFMGDLRNPQRHKERIHDEAILARYEELLGRLPEKEAPDVNFTPVPMEAIEIK